MSKINLPVEPQEATKLLLKKLPSRRMKDVMEKRFGLRGGRKYTLEAIGKEYKITRERVRQIESEALKHLHKEENIAEFKPLFQAVEAHIKNHGEVMGERELLADLSDKKYQKHVVLLLGVNRNFHSLPESEECHERWTVSKEKSGLVEKLITGAVKDLGEKTRPVTREELMEILAKNAKELLGKEEEEPVLNSYLATSRVIRTNPYGEYGLAIWPTINPRGVKDRAYLVLAKAKKPMHFREVARAIEKVGWSKKRAHPQTVHNELIKDNRFVLVGRGMYALKEWGYEPGAVRDVMLSTMKGVASPLTKEEVVKLVSEKRLVKPQTILLNLQNRSLFKKTEDGKYTLV